MIAKKKTCMFLFDAFLYFNMKLIIQFVETIFHPCYNSSIFIKKNILQALRVPIQHCTFLSSLPNTIVMIWKLRELGSHFTPA